MNEYFIQNKTGSPIHAVVLGFVVPARGKTRVLTYEEYKICCQNELPEGLVLSPVLFEAQQSSRALKTKVVEAEAVQDEPAKPSRGRRGGSKGDDE